MRYKILVDPISGLEYSVKLPEGVPNEGVLGGLFGAVLLSLFAIAIVVKLAFYDPFAMTARLAVEGYKDLSEGHLGAAAKKLILPGFVVLVFAGVYAILAAILMLFVILWLVVVV